MTKKKIAVGTFLGTFLSITSLIAFYVKQTGSWSGGNIVDMAVNFPVGFGLAVLLVLGLWGGSLYLTINAKFTTPQAYFYAGMAAPFTLASMSHLIS